MCLGITRESRIVSTLVPGQIDRTETDSNGSNDHNNSQMKVELMNSDNDDSMLMENPNVGCMLKMTPKTAVVIVDKPTTSLILTKLQSRR